MKNIPQFRPGNTVVTLVAHEDIDVGTVGTIVSRWRGTIYAVRLQDGTFHWMDSTELQSIDPNHPILRVGDMAIVTSDEHKHPMTEIGDLLRIEKIVEDVDYYGVMLNNQLHWLAGFELAPYL